MSTQPGAKIFLNTQRGCTKHIGHTSFPTFNYGAYFSPYREPIGALQLINEDTLSAKHSICMRVDSNTDVILIPFVGGLEFKTKTYNGLVSLGELQCLSLLKNSEYTILNPYPNDTISFLQIWLHNSSISFSEKNATTHIDFNLRNQLHTIFSSEPNFDCIGIFDGRTDAIYDLKMRIMAVSFLFLLVHLKSIIGYCTRSTVCG